MVRHKINTLYVVLIALVVVIITHTSCYYDKQEDLYGAQTCDTAQLGYATIQTKLEQQCYGCHTANAPSGNVAIFDYPSLKSYVLNSKNTLLGSVKHTTASPMPKGGQKWDQCSINQLEAWINQGMKP